MIFVFVVMIQEIVAILLQVYDVILVEFPFGLKVKFL